MQAVLEVLTRRSKVCAVALTIAASAMVSFPVAQVSAGAPGLALGEIGGTARSVAMLVPGCADGQKVSATPPGYLVDEGQTQSAADDRRFSIADLVKSTNSDASCAPKLHRFGIGVLKS